MDLLSPDCPIRYIITVNALKEGWDCPFAYVLASLANKTSQVDVEQILGRILRLPYTCEHRHPSLNMSYVLTSSNDFDDTVRRIIQGLNSAGFSDKDYRLAPSLVPKAVEPPVSAQTELSLPETKPENDHDDIDDVDGKEIKAELERRQQQGNATENTPTADTMLEDARKAGEAYNNAVNDTVNDPLPITYHGR